MKDRFEYTCTGKANVKKAAVLISACVISSILLGIASVEDSVFSPYFQIASILFFMISILVSVRFVGTRYSYKLILYPSGEGDIVITELRGFFGKFSKVNVSRTVCRVGLSDITDVTVISGEGDSEKQIKAIRKAARSERAARYNYTADVFPGSFAILRIEDGDGVSYVRFSPDAELLRLIGK